MIKSFSEHWVVMFELYVTSAIVFLTTDDRLISVNFKMKYCETILPSTMIMPILLEELLIFADILAILMNLYMGFDNDMSVALYRLLWRLVVVARYNYDGYIAVPFISLIIIIGRMYCKLFDECQNCCKQCHHRARRKSQHVGKNAILVV